MKSINLPAGTAHVPFGDLAQKIADAMWPGDDHFKRECARSDIADELARAVDAGMFHGLGGKPLPVKNPLTLGPHTFPVGAALQTALVAVNDVRAYVADLGIEVTVEKTVSQPHERVRVHDSDIEAGLRKLPPREAARWENAECDSDTRRRIMCRYAGSQGWRLATLEQFCEEVEGRLNRWRNGRYLVNEAAQVLADANPDTNVKSGIDAEVFCKQMEQAIHANKLTVRLNGIPVAADSLTQYRLHLYTVLQSDVNEWLKNSGAGYALDYPYQTTDADSQAAPLVAESASGGVEPDKTGPAKPLQRTAAQDAAILGEIEKQGYDPMALPKNPPGKSGAKAAVRTALLKNSLFTGGTVFDKAWERLTARADIAIQG